MSPPLPSPTRTPSRSRSRARAPPLSHLRFSIFRSRSLALPHTASPTNRLEKLNLKSNSVGDAGAVALATALMSPHCKLKFLHLQGCDITDVGGQALLDALSRPTSKVTLHLNSGIGSWHGVMV